MARLMRKQILSGRHGPGRVLLAVALGSGLACGAASAADDIDPEATRILKSMSDYLAGTKALTVAGDIDFEVVTKAGEKLQLSSFVKLTLARPAGMYLERTGMFADVQMYFDGKSLTAFSKPDNGYAQIELAGSNDDAILAYELETGIPAPGADLLFSNPYEVLIEGVESARYIGSTVIDGVEVDHLAFREDLVDWQIWVQTGEAPLPLKYVITSKWDAFAPQYQIRLHGWNTQPEIAKTRFAFEPPKAASKIQISAFGDAAELGTTQEDGK